MANLNHPTDSTLIPVDQLYTAVNEHYPSFYQLKESLVGTEYAKAIQTATDGNGGYCHYICIGEEVAVLYNHGIDHDLHRSYWMGCGAKLVTVCERTIVDGRAPERYAGTYLPKGKPSVEFNVEHHDKDKDVLILISPKAKLSVLNCATSLGVIEDIVSDEQWELINSAALKMGKAVGFNNRGEVPFPKGVPVVSYTYQYTTAE
ncbi:MAG: hypothetical protein ACRDBQ_18380 [Shewanella sp.]